MATNRYTEITQQSWFGRIGSSIKTVAIGLIIFIIAFPLLFWNEGRAVRTAKTLDESANVVVSIDATRIDPANNGKLVHVSGLASTDEVLGDPIFGVSANGLQLRRRVAMYQWRQTEKTETREKLGGGTETITTYSYDTVWSEDIINSSQFHRPADYVNPSTKPFESSAQIASRVDLGAFSLPSSMVSRIDNFKRLRVDEATMQSLPEDTQARLKVHDGVYYMAQDPARPQVGDARVMFEVVEPTVVSVVARQVANTFELYYSRAGGTIDMIRVGSHSAEGMFQQAMSENALLTWILRAVGLFIMVFGLYLVFQPLVVIASVVPLFGNMLRLGAGIFAGVVGVALTLFTISLGWVFYRPLISIPLLLVAVAAVYGLRHWGKRKALANTAQPGISA